MVRFILNNFWQIILCIITFFVNKKIDKEAICSNLNMI
jgi:hypothetical protein